MRFQEWLIENRGEVLARWTDRVLASYPEDASRIFKREQDPFANPVGHLVRQSLSSLYQAVFVDRSADLAQSARLLEDLVKVRAVQTFTPSQAVSFLYSLKDVIKEMCRGKEAPELDLEEWFAFEAVVDTLAYQIFDLYQACRERLYQARVQEIKSGNFLMTEGGCCPSTLLKQQRQQRKEEVKPHHIHKLTDVR